VDIKQNQIQDGMNKSSIFYSNRRSSGKDFQIIIATKVLDRQSWIRN